MAGGGFHTITLGCKLNRFDTAAIEGELARRGLVAEPDVRRASVVIVNTCTVTGKADADARKRIRAVRRANPHCRLLVTGCYAELDPGTIRRIDGVDCVFGNRDKERVGEVFDGLGIGVVGGDSPLFDGQKGDSPLRGCDGVLALPEALHFGDRARAFLKVQEGCRLCCSYCVIPTVRGPSRSVPPAEVEAAATRLLASGYREIVLTGVNVGDYGRDLEPRTNLAALLRRLLAGCGPNRIRLNSLEPLTVTDEIVDLMAGDPRLAPHLQVPLQSGSPAILRAMRRNYRVEQYGERLERLRRAVPHVGLGADVIVGFPGETDVHFEETFDFIARSPLNYLHVFSWSPRPGTPAATMDERPTGPVVRQRSARLRELAARLGHRFRRGFVGCELDAIVLGARNGERRLRALSGNFIELSLDPALLARGSLVRARVLRATPEVTLAVGVGGPAWAEAGPSTGSAT